MNAPDLRSRRLLLTARELEVLRELALPAGAVAPPGLDREVDGGQSRDEAVGALRQRGLLAPGPLRALTADLRRLAAAEVTVVVAAARPGLEVSAVLALAGPLGTALLRTGGAAVELTAFAAVALGAELARAVPAPTAPPALPVPVVLPLADLLAPAPRGAAAALRSRWAGALRATVLGPSYGAGRPAPAGAVDWVWLTAADDLGGWAALQPAGGGGDPRVRLVPAEPADLGTSVAPLVGALLAGAP